MSTVDKDEVSKMDQPTEDEYDPWNVIQLKNPGKPWSELDTKGRVFRVLFAWILKPILLIGFLYMFVCALSFLGSAFQLLGGKEAGRALSNNDVLSNPIAGLMIGILATVLLQSSSTTTSILVSMVSAGIISVQMAIPMVMGANIGTSVTNTIVSLGHMKDRDEFRRAFAGATIHDMFNFLSVLVLLPLEVASRYLYHMSKAIVRSFNLSRGSKQDLLKVITNPFTKKIVQLDKKVIISIAKNEATTKSLLKKNCGTGVVESFFEAANVTRGGNETAQTLTVLSRRYLEPNATRVAYNESLPYRMINETNVVEGSIVDRSWLVLTESEIEGKCGYIFENSSLSDTAVGVVLLFVALAILCVCLYAIVKLLHSLLRGRLAYVIKKTINANFPKPFGFLTGYVAILVGTGMTILVQSSSIFTSALTPLVGVGVVTIERTYPLTLGANIGTTVTGLLAALAASGDFADALQLALCHFFFNISGILIWYPIPHLRRVPLYLARLLGDTTADYKWFAVFYLVLVFFLIPAALFGLSLAGWYVLLAVAGPVFILFVAVVVINVLQRKKPRWVHPEKLRNWDFLPVWMHSLEPMDRAFRVCVPKRCRKVPEDSEAASDEKLEMRRVIALNGDLNGGDVSEKKGLNSNDLLHA